MEKDVSELYERCKRYRLNGNNNEALKCFNDAIQYIIIRDNISIFDTNFIKNVQPKYLDIAYKLLDEYSIFSYYTQSSRQNNLRIIDRMIFHKNIWNHVNIKLLTNNQRFYMDKLKYEYKKKILISHEEHYNELNPSIINTGKELIVNCRTSNFGVKPGGVYYAKTSDGLVNTKNYILKMDYKFNIISQKEVIDKSHRKKYNIRRIEGLEDLIIFNYNDQLYGSCTLVDSNEKGLPQIGLCKLEESYDYYIINELTPMGLIHENRCEKNWLPFVNDNILSFVYNYSPMDIIIPIKNYDHEFTGETELISSTQSDLNFERFRGSAGPLKFKDNWLIVVHEVSWCSDNSRIYTHRYVLLDNNFNIIKLSNPWYFENHGLEFCRSMCDFDDNIILSCGIKDEEAWLYVVNKKEIWNSLEDIKKFYL